MNIKEGQEQIEDYKELMIETNKGDIKLKHIPYMKFSDNLNMYFVDFSENTYECLFLLEENEDYMLLSELTFSNWEGIRHSNFFEEGYLNYIVDKHQDESYKLLNSIILMFEKIKYINQYISEEGSFIGLPYSTHSGETPLNS